MRLPEFKVPRDLPKAVLDAQVSISAAVAALYLGVGMQHQLSNIASDA